MSFIVAPVYFDGTLNYHVAVNQNFSTHCTDGDQTLVKQFREVLLEWDGAAWDEVTTFNPALTIVALRIDNPCDGSHQYINVAFNDFRILAQCCQNCPIAAVDANFILPDAAVGQVYAGSFSILGNGPYSMTVNDKPDWMTITLDPDTGDITFAGTPTSGDIDEEVPVNISVNNCGKAASIVLDTTIGVYNAMAFTLRSAPAALYRDIIHDGAQFVAAGELVVAHSDDGITWVAGTNPGTPAGGNKCLAFKAGLYVLVRQTTSGLKRSFVSADGVTFAGGSTLPSNFNSIAGLCYDVVNSLFIAVGDVGTVRAATSPDGVTWTARTINNTIDWRRIRHLNGLNIAVGLNSIATSSNGTTWTDQTVPAGDWTDVAFFGGLYYVVSQDGLSYMTSPDAITWTAQTFDEPFGGGNNPIGIFSANSQLIVFSSNAMQTLSSIDGDHWHPGPGGIGENMAFGDALFAEAGNNGIYTTPGMV